MILKRFSAVTVLTFSLACSIFSQNFNSASFPEIKELKSRNIVFIQYQEDIEFTNRQTASGKNNPVTFYAYTATGDDTLISVSARCCIRQETIATINRLENTSTPVTGKKLILPTKDGLFIPEIPESTLELILSRQYENLIKNTSKFSIDGKDFYFIENLKFTPAQRAFFLTPGFTAPLEHSTITSQYGKRISPISGQWKFHNGIDLAAPLGSNIFACRSGTVVKTGKNDYVYGNYVILRHSEGITSLYAHMDQINVTENQVVAAGHILGKVGTTGLSTGPHLHFEIRQNGISENPDKYLKFH